MIILFLEGTAYTGLVLEKLFGKYSFKYFFRKEKFSFEKLAYSAELTSNKNVSALTWNRKNSNLLAVGYGPFEYNDQHEGLVCCWSLKNQEVELQIIFIFIIYLT